MPDTSTYDGRREILHDYLNRQMTYWTTVGQELQSKADGDPRAEMWLEAARTKVTWIGRARAALDREEDFPWVRERIGEYWAEQCGPIPSDEVAEYCARGPDSNHAEDNRMIRSLRDRGEERVQEAYSDFMSEITKYLYEEVTTSSGAGAVYEMLSGTDTYGKEGSRATGFVEAALAAALKRIHPQLGGTEASALLDGTGEPVDASGVEPPSEAAEKTSFEDAQAAATELVADLDEPATDYDPFEGEGFDSPTTAPRPEPHHIAPVEPADVAEGSIPAQETGAAVRRLVDHDEETEPLAAGPDEGDPDETGFEPAPGVDSVIDELQPFVVTGATPDPTPPAQTPDPPPPAQERLTESQEAALSEALLRKLDPELADRGDPAVEEQRLLEQTRELERRHGQEGLDSASPPAADDGWADHTDTAMDMTLPDGSKVVERTSSSGLRTALIIVAGGVVIGGAWFGLRGDPAVEDAAPQTTATVAVTVADEPEPTEPSATEPPATEAPSEATSGAWEGTDPTGDHEEWGGLEGMKMDAERNGESAVDTLAKADFVTGTATSANDVTTISMQFAGAAQEVQASDLVDFQLSTTAMLPDGTQIEFLMRDDGSVKIPSGAGMTIEGQWITPENFQFVVAGLTLDPNTQIEAWAILSGFGGVLADIMTFAGLTG